MNKHSRTMHALQKLHASITVHAHAHSHGYTLFVRCRTEEQDGGNADVALCATAVARVHEQRDRDRRDADLAQERNAVQRDVQRKGAAPAAAQQDGAEEHQAQRQQHVACDAHGHGSQQVPALLGASVRPDAALRRDLIRQQPHADEVAG